MKAIAPYLLAIAAVLGFGWACYEFGGHVRGLEADLANTQELATARKNLLDANKRVRDAETQLDEANHQLDQLRQKETDHVNTTHDRFVADVRSRAVSVSIPVRAAPCAPGPVPAEASASEHEEARAELTAAAAEDLAAIARDGDLAIVDLNDLIDRYEAAQQTLMRLEADTPQLQ